MTITPDSLRRLADGLANQNSEAERVAARYAASADMLEALKALLACPAIADGGLSDPEWGCQESAEAAAQARAAITKAERAEP